MVKYRGRYIPLMRRTLARHAPSTFIQLVATLSFSAVSLEGQARSEPAADDASWPFSITARIGGGSPTGDTRCKSDAYLLPSLALQTRGRLFVAVAAEWIQPFAVVESCALVALPRIARDGTVEVRADSRFDVDGGAHFMAGIGYQLPLRVQAEAKIGAARGQANLPSNWFPSLTAALGLSIWPDRLIITLDRRWFRVPYWSNRYADEDEWQAAGSPLAPDGSAEAARWRTFHALSFAYRF